MCPTNRVRERDTRTRTNRVIEVYCLLSKWGRECIYMLRGPVFMIYLFTMSRKMSSPSHYGHLRTLTPNECRYHPYVFHNIPTYSPPLLCHHPTAPSPHCANGAITSSLSSYRVRTYPNNRMVENRPSRFEIFFRSCSCFQQSLIVVSAWK